MLTAGDVLNRAINFIGTDQGDRSLQAARVALTDALNDFASLHKWSYFRTQGRVYLRPAYNTGTIAYSLSTNQATLTDGVWPSWAAGAQLHVQCVVSPVAVRVSDTVVTLDSALHLAEDKDAGTAYTLFQDAYELPSDFAQIETPLPEEWGGLRYTPPTGYLWGLQQSLACGTPEWFTIVPGRLDPTRLLMKVFPYADRAMTVDFVYHRRMLPVVYDVGTVDGTVTTTASSTAVVGVGTAFAEDMVGTVFRAGRDSASPEAKGSHAFEAIVAAVADATHLTLATAAPRTLAGVGYSISDYIDLEQPAMATAFQWLVNQSAAAGAGHKSLKIATDQVSLWLIKAREADSRYVGPDRAGPTGINRPFRWRGPVTTES